MLNTDNITHTSAKLILAPRLGKLFSSGIYIVNIPVLDGWFELSDCNPEILRRRLLQNLLEFDETGTVFIDHRHAFPFQFPNHVDERLGQTRKKNRNTVDLCSNETQQ